jgi:hypothetical protein
MITTQQNGANVSVLLAARSINPLSRLFQRELAALLDQLESRRPTLLRSSSASTPNRPATITSSST